MIVTGLQIATKALQYIGAFSSTDESPDPDDLATALESLNDILAEKVGTENLWFFWPATETATLQSGIGEYDLNTITSVEFQFIEFVQLLYNTDKEKPLKMLRRREYEELRGNITGNQPEYVYIERTTNPKIEVLPAPATTGYSLKIAGQKYAPDVEQNNGNTDSNFPASWTRYLSLEVALDISTGKVVTLPNASRNELMKMLAEPKSLLKSRNNKENIKPLRKVRNKRF